MTQIAAPEWFALLSLCIAAVTALALVVVAFRGAHQTRDIRDFVEGALERAQELVAKANPQAVQAVLEQFEAAIVQRVQKTERAFVSLGEEVTDALDRAESLRASASAKESRAKAIRRRAEREETAIQGNGADVAPWDNPALSRSERLAAWERHCYEQGRL